MIGSILVASEEYNRRTIIVDELRSLGYRVIEAESGLRAIELFRKHRNIMLGFIDTVFVDISLPHLISELRLGSRTTPLVLLYNMKHLSDDKLSSVEEAIEAGAKYFMPYNAAKLRIRLITSLLISHSFLEQGVYYGWGEGPRLQDFESFSVRSEAMKKCVSQASELAKGKENIFLMGEHGTGRRDLAYAIHNHELTAKGAFVTIYCAPASVKGKELVDLCESIERKTIAADGGTLCLFNIDYLTPHDQECLIEQLKIAKESHLEFRIIAISATALSVLQNDGTKLKDLLDFLIPATLYVPPLRQRREDIEAIANQLTWRFSLELGIDHKLTGLSGAAGAMLSQQGWPGNISELEHSLYHALLLSDGPLLQLKDFPLLSGVISSVSIENKRDGNIQQEPHHCHYFKEDGNIKTMQNIEEEAIKLAIEHYKGRLSEVARRLKIGRSTLYRKIESWQHDKI